MTYANHDEELQVMKTWRKRLKEKNLLKKAGYSNEEIKILDRTLNNKNWRMSHLYKIRTKDGFMTIFKPNRAQSEFIKGAHNRNIILKSRQLGFTTFECIDILDEVLFNENYLALMIFHTKLAAEDAFRNKITLAWENIPNTIKRKFQVDADKAGEIRFKHSEGVYSAVACRTSGMSGTYSRLHVSEFGIVASEEPTKANELLIGTFPSVPSSGRLDIESTARGANGLFYDMYMKALEITEAERTPSDFKPWFFNWTWDDKAIGEVTKNEIISLLNKLPEELKRYQVKYNLTNQEICFYYKKLKEYSLPFAQAFKKMKSEYPTTIEEAFEGSGIKLFDIDVVNRAIQNAAELPPPEMSGQWRYYASYRPNHRYAIGVDVAEGVGRDSSAITVMDFTHCTNDNKGNPEGKAKVVATYSNDKIAPDILAYEIRNVARIYGNPLVAVERNNHGHATLAILKQIYPSKLIYRQILTDKLTNQETERLGWDTNGRSKPIMFYDLKTAVEDERFECYALEILREMMTYDESKLNQLKDKEEETNHWDLLVSAAICYQMRDLAKLNEPKKKKREESFNKFDII